MATSRDVTERTAARPASAFSRETSLSTQAMPRAAFAWAMPAPIMPAPRTPTRAGFQAAKPAGRALPALIAFRSKKNALIMFFAVCPTMTFASLRLSIRIAVSTSTSAPSTIVSRIASLAG